MTPFKIYRIKFWVALVVILPHLSAIGHAVGSKILLKCTSVPKAGEIETAAAAEIESTATADNEITEADQAEDQEDQVIYGNPAPIQRLITFDTACHTNFDKASALTSRITLSMPVNSLQNFEERVSALAEKLGKFNIICIDGHGSQDIQGVGGAGAALGSSENDLKLSFLKKQKEWLKRLRTNFLIEVTDSTVTLPIVVLLGCNVATDISSGESKLLMRLSKILNNTVLIGFNTIVSSIYDPETKHIIFTSGTQLRDARLTLFRARIYLNGESIEASELVELVNMDHEDLEDLLFEWPTV